MTRKEYTESVLSALRHVTQREREAIRAEIDGHIEDHMADLLELDYPPELAEERTLSAMGDPKEVGRELNRQYPLRWLVIGRMAMAAVLVFALVAAGPVWNALRDTVLPNFQARWFPTAIWDLTETTISELGTGRERSTGGGGGENRTASDRGWRDGLALSGGAGRSDSGEDHRLVCRQPLFSKSLQKPQSIRVAGYENGGKYGDLRRDHLCA